MREWREWAGPGVAFGGDYNPEQWSPDTWREDVALMREAGVTFVSLAIFSWSHLQPAPDRWEFGWLDEVMDLLADGGVSVDLATATASPPPWFSHRYPETLPQRPDGVRLWQGSRQAWCPSSTVFTEHATALTAKMAERYRDHPALSMWHVSNEYGCHNAPCYCDVSAAAFRDWLRERYGDVEGVNEAWGTSFWSQRYGDLQEIVPPRTVPTFNNPAQVLDFRRFTSDALLAQYRAELDVLRRTTPEVPVTTNFMTLESFRHLDYPRWAPHVDVVSTDHYLTVRQDPEAELAFGADLTRGLADGGPWLLMEHSTSAVNWQAVNPAKAPGQMLRHSLAHVARGADGVGFFQWRASRSGAEKFHSALVPHAGTDSRVWREVVELGAVAGRLGELRGSRVEAEVALLWDYEAGWACNQEAHPSSEVRYGDVAHDLHGAFRRRGVTVDVVPVTADLSGYRVVLVPTLYLCSDDTAAKVTSAAESGAHVVVTYFSGIVDERDQVRLGGYPGAFRDLLGVRTEEFYPLGASEVTRLDGELAPGSTASLWSELLTCVDAVPMAHFADGPLAGGAAVTRRERQGAGAWYVATRLDADGNDALVDRLLAESGVQPAAEVPAGVEVVRRRHDDRSWLFVINHTDAVADVPAKGYDLVQEAQVDGLHLPAGRVAVVREH